MTKKKHYYITTTIPYVNADPHIGFALEIVQADTIARYHRLVGDIVFHNFGTDEHGIKIYRKAVESGKSPQDYVDEYAAKFKNLKKALNLECDNFIRTTDANHKKVAQEFWLRCEKNGDIYKKNYKAKYCVGCELEKTDSELVNGGCEYHPNLELETFEEENYFFRFSKYQEKLLELYNKNPDFVYPPHRLKEIKTFVEVGLKDFSISRLTSKLPWGVPVPGDADHVMYVWFDALVNYISALGWPKNQEKFKRFWPGVQTAGKDNLRQQSAIWQAMLMSAGLPNSKQIFIHGFINSGGERMSKSLGNVVDPFALVSKYGTDTLRYYLLAKIHPFEDSNFTIENFEEVYQSDLANGLGNLVSRVAGLTHNSELKTKNQKLKISKNVARFIEKYQLNLALEAIWQRIKDADVFINKRAVWSLKGKQKEVVLLHLTSEVRQIAIDLKPFLPDAAGKVESQFKTPKIKNEKPLFPRLQ